MIATDLRWLDAPNQSPEHGWIEVVTPLGASVHVRVDSPAWDLCTDWQILQGGRGLLRPTNPIDWFGSEILATYPVGLVAETFASANLFDEFMSLMAHHPDARSHVMRLPGHVFGAEPEEIVLLAESVDLARRIEVRLAAELAAAEAVASSNDQL